MCLSVRLRISKYLAKGWILKDKPLVGVFYVTVCNSLSLKCFWETLFLHWLFWIQPSAWSMDH